MTELLTQADIAEAIGMLAGCFAAGFVAGRLHRLYVQISEKL